MILALYVFIIFIGLLLAQEVFRRFPKLALGVFSILSALLILQWIKQGIRIDWFNDAKVFSVAFAVIWFSVFRMTSFGETKFAKAGIYLILVVNMLEAITRDVLAGGTAHYLNAIAGILLIVTLRNIDSISVTKDKFKDVVWDKMTLMWIIGNTLWDWTFVYLNFVSVSAIHIAVLGAPLVIAFINKGRWLQVRTLTLGTYLFSYFFLAAKLYSHVESYFWKNETFEYAIATASFIFMLIYVITFLRSSGMQQKGI
ncbi:MAG TPA: DUF5692 family protein [Candidatus Moranbacteria bacterium]|nr:DUF5692 family protein [Candidatus Moranbacteria bacterium]HRY28308.1 DUF5692 family protein [Candidatus Moranbacteria bacterium]HSA08080.1 DUF5692 family protein [Candidatus Moranbacteria bacterium]